VDALKSLSDFQIGEMKFPETKIGETVVQAQDWLKQAVGKLERKPETPGQPPSKLETAANVAEKVVEFAQKHWAQNPPPAPKPPAAPPKLPLPPITRPRMRMKRGN
jgi:hypothetical protein